jgi:hypothetical protein
MPQPVATLVTAGAGGLPSGPGHRGKRTNSQHQHNLQAWQQTLPPTKRARARGAAGRQTCTVCTGRSMPQIPAALFTSAHAARAGMLQPV